MVGGHAGGTGAQYWVVLGGTTGGTRGWYWGKDQGCGLWYWDPVLGGTGSVVVGVNGQYGWLVLGAVGVVLGWTGEFWAIVRKRWAVLGCTGLCWAVLDCAGL